LQLNFFIDYFGQHLSIGWNLIVPLIKLTFPANEGGARTEMQRKVAQKLFTQIIKRTSKTTDAKIIEKAMSKYEKVAKVVSAALDLKGWKKPVKYWQHYLSMFLTLAKTLTRNGVLNKMESAEGIKKKVEDIVANDKSAAGLKGKLKEFAQIIKS